MTLLLREVMALVAGATAWLAIVTALAVLAGFVVALPGRRPPSPRMLRWAVLGGLVTAGVASRLGFADPLGIAVMRRPLPVVFVASGAVVGALLGALRPRPAALSDRAAG